MDERRRDAIRALSGAQAGLVTLAQLTTLGLRHEAATRRADHGEWSRLAPGIYQVHGGPVVPEARAWAGVLLGGDGSAVVGEVAAFLHGLAPVMPEVVTVAVPHVRRVRDTGQWHFERRRVMPTLRGAPPRSGVEDTVLDLCAAEPQQAEHWVTEAVRRGRTTRPRLAAALVDRSRHPARRDLEQMLAASQEGIESPLESLFARRVLRAHGLPTGRRQVRRRGERVDVWFEQGLVVELDGRLGHEGPGRFRDMARDNRHALEGIQTLRYGWSDCRWQACAAAEQVARMLQLLGWAGLPTRCPDCR